MNKVSPLLVFYLFLSFLFFYFVALDDLNGISEFKFYVDSKEYEEYALYGGSGDLTEISFNRFGPITILNILGPRNYWLIFLFNLTIFYISLRLLSNTPNINKTLLFFLVMIQPITFTSLMSINKEIICLLCTALLIYNHRRKKLFICILLVFLTYMARWQFTLFYLLYLLVFSKINFLSEKRFVTLIVLLTAVTIGLFLFRDTFLGEVFYRYDAFKDNHDAHGSGTFRMLMTIQDRFGYIVAFLPKTLLFFSALLTNYNKVFDNSDVYNNLVMFFQTVAYVTVLAKCFFKRLFKLENDFFYIAILYCIVFNITPIFSPRYLYPAIILLCYELSIKRDGRKNDARKTGVYKCQKPVYIEYGYKGKNQGIENNNQC